MLFIVKRCVNIFITDEEDTQHVNVIFPQFSYGWVNKGGRRLSERAKSEARRVQFSRIYPRYRRLLARIYLYSFADFSCAPEVFFLTV
jgi:hypothetical protein